MRRRLPQNSASVTPQAVAQASDLRPPAPSQAEDTQRAVPGNGIQLDDGQVLMFDDQGNPVILGSDGRLQFGDDDGATSNDALQQFGGRRSRQFGGFSQQAPNFSGPIGRSRGS